MDEGQWSQIETETLIFASQEKVIKTNIVQCNINRMMDTPLWRLYGEKNETSATW